MRLFATICLAGAAIVGGTLLAIPPGASLPERGPVEEALRAEVILTLEHAVTLGLLVMTEIELNYWEGITR